MFNTITTIARSSARTATARLPLPTFTSTSLHRNTSSSSSTDSPKQVGEQATAGELKIRQILTQRFSPSVLKVQDVSGGCGSFYAIQLSSKEFKGMSTVKAHRLVNSELKDVIKDIHGLQLRTVAED